MLLKLIGSLMVLSASSVLGYVYSRECSRRPQELRDLQGLMHMFENEINYMSNLITDAFDKIYRSSNSQVALFFKEAMLNMKKDSGLNASRAWETAVRNNIGKTALNKEDESVLISFGNMLGSSDLDGQIKNIKLVLSQLKLQEEKAEKHKNKNQNMYRSLGLLGGLAIVIILF